MDAIYQLELFCNGESNFTEGDIDSNLEIALSPLVH